MCLSQLLQSGTGGRVGEGGFLTVVSCFCEQEGIGELGEWGYKEPAQELPLPAAQRSEQLVGVPASKY